MEIMSPPNLETMICYWTCRFFWVHTKVFDRDGIVKKTHYWPPEKILDRDSVYHRSEALLEIASMASSVRFFGPLRNRMIFQSTSELTVDQPLKFHWCWTYFMTYFDPSAFADSRCCYWEFHLEWVHWKPIWSKKIGYPQLFTVKIHGLSPKPPQG